MSHTCIFLLGQNFEILIISMQKKPAIDGLYPLRRTKIPKWSREPNDLKCVLQEQNFFKPVCNFHKHYIDDSVQDGSNSSALAMELLQSCTKPSISGHYLYSTVWLRGYIPWGDCNNMTICQWYDTMFQNYPGMHRLPWHKLHDNT